MNRCDEIEDLDVYRRTLKGMNPQVQIVFEDAEGEIEEVTEADLPFDVNAEVIEIPPEAHMVSGILMRWINRTVTVERPLNLPAWY